MADYTTIDNPGLFFNTVLYNGTGSANSITGVGFQPDWVWIKQRNGVTNHKLHDAVRGSTKVLGSNETSAEATVAQGVTSFDSDGFSLGTDTSVNGAGGTGGTYVAWNWLGANGTVSNSDGSISSTVSANQTAGFSVVTYTGNGTAGATVGHGLGSVPKMIIVKVRNTTNTWVVYHTSLGATKFIEMDSTGAVQTNSTRFNDTEPTSSVFSLGSAAGLNTNSDTHVAYCFAEKQGYSKFGKFTGNGNADGPFVYTGFKPAWIMLKETSGTSDWSMYDNKREPFNVADSTLEANTTDAEAAVSGRPIDILSNGFKLRGDSSFTNENGATYIYWAFAEHPFVTAGTKAAGTAR